MLIEKILDLSERGYDVTLTSDHVSETVTIIVMKDRKAIRKFISEEFLYSAACGPEEFACIIIDCLIEEMEKKDG